jgi:hypothetical protein
MNKNDLHERINVGCNDISIRTRDGKAAARNRYKAFASGLCRQAEKPPIGRLFCLLFKRADFCSCVEGA